MRSVWTIVLCAVLAAFSSPARAQTAFSDELVIGGWDQAVGVCFDATGRGYVWEKGGKVWLVEGGVKSAQPLIDITEEVGNWRDYGLVGFAVDPNFYTNGYIYLSYVVDYHHLKYFGTPQYDPQADEFFHDTIARITRYTTDPSDGFRSVLPGSRNVLLGESMTTGAAITHESHGAGTLIFGEDGMLLASMGEGASFDTADVGGPRTASSNTALIDGIITPEEDVGALRSQMIDSLSGKILRLDPATGDGVPSNPFYNTAAPRAPRSRVWTLGMRNPFRICLKPGTGSADPADGDPGTIFVGDVGWNTREELSMVPTGGLNLGWPLFEGLEPQGQYMVLLTPNAYMPNPLDAINNCGIPLFRFQDLIVQETLGPTSFPNPCDAGVQIGSETPTFEQVRPFFDWGHGYETRVGTFTGDDATFVLMGDPSSPIHGEQFLASSSAAVAGCWYTGTNFPPEYQNTLLFSDFTGGFIKSLEFDEDGHPHEVRSVVEFRGPIVCVTMNPIDEEVYYITYNYNGNSALRRVRGTDNVPPVVHAAVTPEYGPLPADVSFSSAGTIDPDGTIAVYSWDFGDGTPRSSEANPTHTFAPVQDITADGTIVSRIQELVPPTPLGLGAFSPEVIRDGIRPTADAVNPQLQYDTYHAGDQGLVDWIGYTFPTPRELRSMLFQEGLHFGDGGWFDVLTVEALIGGVWTPVTNMASSPTYPAQNDGVNFDTYCLTFDAVMCDGIRIYGVPGGNNERFITVAELRAYATAVPANQPLAYTITFTATDNGGQAASTTIPFYGNNTPPEVLITSPVDGQPVPANVALTLPLTAVISDAESPNSELTCTWQVILHHDAHTHPEPATHECESQAVFSPHGTPGEIVYYEVYLTVSDPAGHTTTRSVNVYISHCDTIDFNGDGLSPDTADIDDFLLVFSGGPCSNEPMCGDIDFNNDGFFPDTLDIDSLLSVFSGGPCLE